MKPEQKKDPRLLVQSSPLLAQRMTTRQAMRDVFWAVLPATLAGVWLFGMGALLVLLASIAGALVTEWVFSPRAERRERLGDYSGLLTGLLLGLSVPPGLPLWMAFLGGAVGMGLGKLAWGGLGRNLFNPALVGRAFLASAFPSAMTTWRPPSAEGGFFDVPQSVLAVPFGQAEYDSVTAATPLGLMKFEHQGTPLSDLLLGSTSGCIGETSAVLIVLGGIYLILRRDADWRVPLAVILAVIVCTGLVNVLAPDRYGGPLFAALSGGLLLGAFFMATDPVTSPITPRGAWIYGCGIGVLVVLIRVFGGFPEGVMYAVLLMNSATPLIDRYTQPRVFGQGIETK